MLIILMLNLIISILLSKTQNYVSFVTLSAQYNQKLSKLLRPGLERLMYWNECKTKSEHKNTTNKYRYFLE